MPKLAKATKSSAPGSYLGFSQQQVRLLHHLLSCPEGGCCVSLEHLDDVAVHYANGELLLEQDKSATATNPLADTSKDLWKTIAHWIDLIESNQIALDRSQFHLYVTPARSGPWATLLSHAQTDEELEPLLKKANALVMRKAPPACAPDLAKFVNLAPDVRLELVKRMTIISTDENPLEPVRERLRPTLGPAQVDATCEMGLGMAVSRVEELLRAGKPALVDADAFMTAFRAAARKSNMPGYLTNLAGEPGGSAVKSKLLARPIFVQQLDLIESDQEERIRAVADFLQASANKVKWADAGLIHESSLDEFDDTLARHHAMVSKELKVTHSGHPEVAIGQLRYSRCSQFVASLEGHSVPSFFVPGCLHALAESYRIGWHPDFFKKLGGA
ncbi:MAG: hypothetical protein NTW01_01180 [Gammaproteobacteria bacterium]|nr:hypothetical protein [Gammaproteobacteria bacterium]